MLAENEQLLNFSEQSLTEQLEAALEYGPFLWGPGITAREAATRLLTVHLEESLETRPPHPSGQWTYRDGGFDPRPPWEKS